MFLLLLANDRAVLGPWVNPGWLNAIASLIIGILVMLSAILAAVTLFPGISMPTMTLRLSIGLALGLGGVAIAQLRSRGHEPEWKLEYARIDKLSWQMPPLEDLPRLVWSLARKVGILTLRGYLAIAVLLVAAKIVQLALAGHA